jgi:hypothetical protein
MKKVKVKHFRGVHYEASCDVCDFNEAINIKTAFDHADVRREVRQHVLKTGHSVIIEKSDHARYSLQTG